MEIQKSIAVVEGNEGTVNLIDTIEYNGTLWLVPDWIYTPDKQWIMPERMIRLDQFDYVRSQSDEADYLVHDPIPKAVLADPFQSQEAEPYIVLYGPSIRLPAQMC